MAAPGARSIVLVEGVSDQGAVEALAARYGRDLDAEGVSVVAMGGATNIGHHLSRLAENTPEATVTGLVDEAQAPVFVRALRRAGRGEDLAAAGFFVCVADLEDELIRTLGTDLVEQILHDEGDLLSYRKFQRQPAQRGRPDDARLRRFMGTRGGRKIHYGPVLVNALPLDRVPLPLRNLLTRM
ncbi:hypothetical protein CFN78_21180 [Amycolatopsis antarctica]|uniref:OLD protein-like TOPRIM domain-containing protein n=1 Tax=Amycolatopsis antarctica TaxID=1854586 RepID=A0A263CYR1_9PSEU|nr:TOPRIM nucleotidyl transferase/hydrolase domain-containing protein [Amycolatopsis antarctica]OZM71304.1 hypothetical protein CFN78_21180 [Amycolatopsis antarctica]